MDLTKKRFSYLLLVFLLSEVAYASNVNHTYLNNINNPGTALQANQTQSSAQWVFNASLNSSGSSFSANLSAGAINYTDSLGRTATATYPLEIIGNASNIATAYYQINSLGLIPIQELYSYVTLGSVYQGSGQYQNGVNAAQCNFAGLYSEWDFYVHVQPDQQSAAKNVVVGRVCIYNKTVGWAGALTSAPVQHSSTSIYILANGASQQLSLADNSTVASSPDGLAKAWWIGTPGIYVAAAIPNGTSYVALNGTTPGSWIVQSNSIFSKWQVQFYKFTVSQIPALNEQYSPSSVGILSSSCNLVFVTDLTNKSIDDAINCMNSTAATYYYLANQQAVQLLSSPLQNMSGYNYSSSMIYSKPAIALNLPSAFDSVLKMGFEINGQVLGYALPSSAPQLLIASSSPVTLYGSGMLNLMVQNSGRISGTFTVSITGCPGIRTVPKVSYLAGPGQAVNVTAYFTAPNQNLTLNTECAVQVIGSGNMSNSKMVNIVSQTPNEYLHGQLQGVQNTLCSSDGIFTQLLCSYIGLGYS